MKSMTFDEFFATPPGTIFGQATGLPNQDGAGLYVKGESFSKVDILEGDGSVKTRREAGVHATYALIGGHDFEDEWFISTTYPGDCRRFLVYEAADIDRLAGLIGRGPVAHGEDAS